ncbi:tyrosine-type recombinase/integrase [Micromonospora sicca]|uniref:Tyrosine-type recombinase/integrase n=1 Tax=Micromonospora sicca TaxID=2202420 RepID=A0ABU5J7G3_9ACTN|nr:tyrosine-type recombinase/integrase [Micromonospora sp. 4G53]MDZ5488530.1 tyrosine-type recombinase/integrase [Micromonospora sp. 4G53]
MRRESYRILYPSPGTARPLTCGNAGWGPCPFLAELDHCWPQRPDPIQRTGWAYPWKKAVEAVDGVPEGFGCHGLRHYFATLLIHGGASVKTVQMALGHATPIITLDTYAGGVAEAVDRTRNLVDAGPVPAVRRSAGGDPVMSRPAVTRPVCDPRVADLPISRPGLDRRHETSSYEESVVCPASVGRTRGWLWRPARPRGHQAARASFDRQPVACAEIPAHRRRRR